MSYASLGASSRQPVNARPTEPALRSLSSNSATASFSSSFLLSNAQRSNPPPPSSTSSPSAYPAALDDRSAQIADYVEKRRQAKANAESIRKERAREAELRKLNGGGGGGAGERSSPSPPSQPIPRSGIVRGDASGPSSEASSVSNSRRGSRGRDSGEWSQAAGAGRPHTVSREAEEDDDEETHSLHRYAKPSRSPPARPPTSHTQQPTASMPPPRALSTSAVHPVSAAAARPSSVFSSSPSSSPDAALVMRVAELEAQVVSLEKQQRLFLAFMETTQAQLALMRIASAQPHLQPQAQPRSVQLQLSTGRAEGLSGASRKESAQSAAQRAKREQETRKGEEQRHMLEQREEEEDGEDVEEDDRREDEYGDRYQTPQPQPTRSSHPPAQPPPPTSRGRPPSQPSTNGDGPGHSHSRQPSSVQTARRSGGVADSPSTSNGRSSQQRAPSHSPPPSSSPRPPPPAPASSYDAELLETDPFPVVPTFPCPECGRSFNELALAKHVSKGVCQRTRKVFDVKAQRLGEVVGELAKVQSKGGGEGKGGRGKKEGGEKVSKWRQERARLQEAIQAGKAIEQALKEGKSLASIPVAVSSVPDDRVQCPHCLRRFAEQSADRHIPHCKNRNARLGNTQQIATANSNAQRRR